MRECPSCNGEGETEFEEGVVEPCNLCEGTGRVEDGCYCCARTPFECGCGGWSDVDLDGWEDY